MLRPGNERAYLVLLKLYRITERDGYTGYMRLNYRALRDFMRGAQCARLDRDKIFRAWAVLRNRDIERIEKERESDKDGEKKEREEFLRK